MKTFTLIVISVFVFALNTHSQNPELWGLTSAGGQYGGGTIYKMNPDGSNFSVMHNFQSPAGWLPVGKLMKAWDGKYYGACYEGGIFASCTIFRYDPLSQQYEDVWDFDIVNGDFPRSGLLQGPGGVLYGVVPFGGNGSGGVIYSYNITTDTYTNLHNFNTTPSWGIGGWALPVLVNNHVLYGTTVGGGTNGAGTLWKYDVNLSQYTHLWDFDDLPNGSEPFSGLIQASDGKLYGMCKQGGTTSSGTIYSYNINSNTFIKLHEFDDINGKEPKGSLYEYTPGVLYGMTEYGGANNSGTIFRFTISTNTFEKLHDFNPINGSHPQGDLTADPVSGLLAGVTDLGGVNGVGAFFTYDPVNNIYSKLYDFTGSTGSTPTGGVVPFLTTSLNENSYRDYFIIYPNPVKDKLNIHYTGSKNEDVVFSVKNVLGQVVMQWKENELSEAYNKAIDMSNLQGGIYILESSSDEFKFVERFIKK